MRRASLAELVPAGVQLVESAGPPFDAAPLHRLEIAAIASARRERRLEFAAGRACAREALCRLGRPAGPIPVGPAREPIWPDGVVGSITHCRGFCAAAVASRARLRGLGIDAEGNAPLDAGVAERVCLPHEIAALPDDAGASWAVVLFSARESIFKAWYPTAHRWLDYHDIEVILDLTGRQFRARPLLADLVATELAHAEGRFAWSHTHVFTAAWIAPESRRLAEKRADGMATQHRRQRQASHATRLAHADLAVTSKSAVRGATIWLTGLPGAGKSSIAAALSTSLAEAGRPAYVLDGDRLRAGLNADLGFSADDRAENARRTAHVAALLADAGLIAITALVSPYAADRDRARRFHESADLAFIEVFVDTPLAVCERRDAKGHYARARRGELPNFTGVDDPYEPPLRPDVRVDGAALSVERGADLVMKTLVVAGLIDGTRR